MINRRAFLGSLGLLAAPRAAEAQPAGKVARVGVLHVAAPEGSIGFAALRDGLRNLGYVEGKNIVFEYRWPQGKREHLPAVAVELAKHSVDVIVTADSNTTRAAKHATGTIPIVMAVSQDPVAEGLVASLAHPGGNVTGLSSLGPEFSGKRLELLKEVVPRVNQVVLLWNPKLPQHAPLLRATEVAARPLGVKLLRIEASGLEDIERAFQAAVAGRAGALLALPAADFFLIRAQIAALGLKHRLPTLSYEAGFAKAGGLVQYGANAVESWRHAATYVDKILRGAKPADLPVQQPTKFELVINLKTAKALGLTIPPSLLARADQVIE